MALELVQQTINDNLNVDAVEEWQEYRTAKKKPLSPLALKKSQNLLMRFGYDQQQLMVDSAIMNDWQGLHPVEEPRQQTSRQTSIQDDLNNTDWAR